MLECKSLGSGFKEAGGRLFRPVVADFLQMKVNFENSWAPNLRFEPRAISGLVDDHQTTQLP